MKNIMHIIVGLLICLLSALATASPLVEVSKESVKIALPPYIDILEDEDGSLTINDVMSERYAMQFSPAPMTELFFGYTKSVYWMRFTVENQRDISMDFVLETSPADIDHLDLFVVDAHTGQLVQHKKAGSAMPYGDRDYDNPLYLFDLNIEGHSATTYYLRAESDKTINIQLLLSTPREYFNLESERTWWQGLLLGSLLCACVLHMIFFILFRFRGFLWYSLFIATVIGIQVSWNGYLLQFFNNSEKLLDHQILFPIYLSIVFSVLFAQTLLKTRKRVPWQHHTLTAMAVAGFIGAVVTWFIPPYLNSLIASIFAIFSMAFVFAATLHANMEGYRMPRHFLLARTVTAAVVLVSIFNIHGYLSQGSFTAWGIAAAIVVESIVMAMSMAWCCLEEMREKQVKANEGRADPAPRSLVNLSDICHELRTPISGVLGMADLLLGGNITDQQKNQIKTIHKSGQALLDVTNKLSDLSSIERGNVELNTAPFELTQLVESCIESCRGRAEFNNIELIYHLDSNVIGFVKGDQEKLQQTIINLLQFALRHLEKGEVILSIAPTANSRLEFMIRSGENTLAERNLLPGSHVLGSSDQLNLTVAEQYIMLMGGSLSIRSYIDGGVSIRFVLALEKHKNGAMLQSDNLMLQGRRMLIVDDNATCCTIIEQQAAQWGMTAVSAHGGKEALAILRTHTTVDELFDIVLMDYDMPGMNGMELATHIREDQNINSEKLLLIMLTGVSKAPSKIASESAAIQRVLFKPLSGKSLKQALQLALTQHAQGRRD
ncbi:MAG TPA: 7TM-DISM domain-containing protein [Pseudomonadales bacterium]|nr:7TM-DISM domain-containing protein [Pseudomonadales bacterium]